MVQHLTENHRHCADAVAEFFGEGFLSGDSMLAVVDTQRWYAVAMRRIANGLPVDDAMRA